MTPDPGAARSLLFEPVRLNGLTLRNRFVMSAMSRYFSPDGVPGSDVAQYYRRRAAGGVGLIVTEGTGVDHPAAVDHQSIPLMHGERALAGWKVAVEAVHGAGGLVAPQLWHQGPIRRPEISRRPDVGDVRPSGLWGPLVGKRSLDQTYIDRALVPTAPASEEEISDLIAAFERSARNAADVGVDAIALHAGHGYLIDSFLWAATNLRTDQWGGDPARRPRFAVELVKACRRSVGIERPIIFRLSHWKVQDYRASLVDSPQELETLLGPIADAGVDLFDCSQRYIHTPAFADTQLNLAGWAKKLTGKMSMAVGGVGLSADVVGQGSGSGPAAASDNLDAVATRVLHGEFDLVGVGRSLLNDPAWLAKAKAGVDFMAFDPRNLKRLT